jgi:hypothetical protein
MTSGKGKDETAPERRASVRTHLDGALKGDIELQVGSDVLFLSSGGMMMRLEQPPEVGSRHRFTLDIDGRSLEMDGIIRNITPDGLTSKVGVEFQDVSYADRSFLEAFVARKLAEE